jgi:hypothetical protein
MITIETPILLMLGVLAIGTRTRPGLGIIDEARRIVVTLRSCRKFSGANVNSAL